MPYYSKHNKCSGNHARPNDNSHQQASFLHTPNVTEVHIIFLTSTLFHDRYFILDGRWSV
ncbi:hypothetical protein ISKNV_00028 [Infectious spleen and kidney necrosis virus]|nr:hypothetical protein ISKNV_00028 [Infectious spleen and kidney necrosis virus]